MFPCQMSGAPCLRQVTHITRGHWPIRGQYCDQSEAWNHMGHLTRGHGSVAGDIRLLSGVFTFHSLYMLPVIWCRAVGDYGGFFPLFPLFSFPACACAGRKLVVPKDRRSLLDEYDYHFHNLRKLRQWLWWLLCSNNYRTEMIITQGWHDDMGMMMVHGGAVILMRTGSKKKQ